MKNFLFLIFLFPCLLFSQDEIYPVFDTCKEENIKLIKQCFYKQTKQLFFKEFKTPRILIRGGYEGTVNAVFTVTKKGNFKLIHINTPYIKLESEVERVFKTLPKVKPAMYNNHAVEMQYILPISFPLGKNPSKVVIEESDTNREVKKDFGNEVNKGKLKDTTSLELKSQLNIPFTHQNYVDYELALHKASNTHTASKPYLFSEINPYYNLEKERKSFLKPEKKSWWSRKLWNEHLLQVNHKDYWFTLDALFDVQLGKDNSTVKYTFNNSRILNVNGGFGSKFSFSATIYESQGRFAKYVNTFIGNKSETFKPSFSEGLVPGRGKAKGFKTNAFDYPVAEGYLSYTPNKYMQFQFGHGKNFIGDGYRSFLLSDVASPSLYLKAKANFWKFQYTNLWLWARDVRFAEVINNEHARKYIAIHYLSINLTKKLNIGLFETAISANQTGFDAGFLNPLIFYRAVEFNRGEDSGNAMVGLTAKYKVSKNALVYSQLLVDEFSVGNLSDLGDWRNKFGLQLGAKYFNAFQVKNLFLQAEFNYARPFTFAHKTPVLNFGHYSQPLGHLWGANFWEAIGIARYKKDRWSGFAKLVLGKKGFDFDNQATSYGGDIYKSYKARVGDTGNSLSQGNTANIFHFDAQGNYLLNPSNNMSLFAGFSFRRLSSNTNSTSFSSGNNFWFTAGVKANLFNWYFDF